MNKTIQQIKQIKLVRQVQKFSLVLQNLQQGQTGTQPAVTPKLGMGQLGHQQTQQPLTILLPQLLLAVMSVLVDILGIVVLVIKIVLQQQIMGIQFQLQIDEQWQILQRV
ncbi:hypothetical protein FACS189475_04290 [Betaproteobacteria bacterium]|nr:hypothetical protein FACS189475_04290 [Betaproteobacteria bacterium]